jgi:hypothetical protein
MSRRTRRLGLALAAISLAGALAGCNGGSDDDSGSPPGQTSVPTESSPTEPTDTPSTSEFTSGATENPDGSSASRARASRIPADELPGLNDAWTWRVESRGPGPGEFPPSLCTLSSLESIGASSTYRTDYDSKASKADRATVMTAVFPDEHTATLAKTVLRSWHAQCERRLKNQLGYKRVSVSPIDEIATDVGPAEHWLSAYGPLNDNPDEGWFQAEGFVADGDTLTYVVILSVGQDYDYEPGQQPVELALGIAGAKLAQSR